MKNYVLACLLLCAQLALSQEFQTIDNYTGFIPAEFDNVDYTAIEDQIYQAELAKALASLKTDNTFTTMAMGDAVDPIAYATVLDKLSSANLLATPVNLEDFNYTKTEVYLQKSDGSLSGFGVVSGKDSYKVLYTFQHYKIISNSGNRYRYGIEITIKADIKSNRKSVDLNSLFQLAVSASKNRIKGNLSLEAKGFQSASVYTLMNINAGIDEASVQQTIKNAGILIAELNDSSIQLKPVILGREK